MKTIDVRSMRLGSDAEFFLQDLSGRFFPACGLVGGTKHEPIKLTEDGVMIQEDNVMVEFNTPICATPADWAKQLSRSMQIVYKRIPPSFRPVVVPAANFDHALLQLDQAQVFGCEPDFNAWTMERNPRPEPEDPTFRSAAAHVHISWNNPEDLHQRCRVIQMADVYVSLMMKSYIGDVTADNKRRTLYGRAGAFRPKEYGVEHRVLGNGWLIGGRDLHERMYRWYQRALTAVSTPYEFTKEEAAEIQYAINEEDSEKCYSLHKKLNQKIFPKANDDTAF